MRTSLVHFAAIFAFCGIIDWPLRQCPATTPVVRTGPISHPILNWVQPIVVNEILTPATCAPDPAGVCQNTTPGKAQGSVGFWRTWPGPEIVYISAFRADLTNSIDFGLVSSSVVAILPRISSAALVPIDAPVNAAGFASVWFIGAWFPATDQVTGQSYAEFVNATWWSAAPCQ